MTAGAGPVRVRRNRLRPEVVCLVVRIRSNRDAGVAHVTEALAQIPLLSTVSGADLRRLAQEGRLRRYSEGEVVLREGAPGCVFFVLLAGSAAVSREGAPVRALNAGDSFGEIAALRGGDRTATVVAATDLECLALTSWVLHGFLRTHAPVAAYLTRQVARLLRWESARSD